LVPVKEESSKSIDTNNHGFDSLVGGIVEALRILEGETGIGDHCLSGLSIANRILYVERITFGPTNIKNGTLHERARNLYGVWFLDA
jgi:hypothetical protein